jgi:hypothetical protein
LHLIRVWGILLAVSASLLLDALPLAEGMAAMSDAPHPSTTAADADVQELATPRRSLVKGVAWATPALIALAPASAYAGSPLASGALGSLCTGAMDLNTDTIEATVAFGVLVPAGATVAAGKSFTFTVTTDGGGAPAALAVSGLGATTSVSGSGPSYVYTITIATTYTNTSGSDQFFAGGVAWTGANALPVGTTITTADSGPVVVDSSDTCYYTAF